MTKPISNAPVNMQPWVDATDAQLASIEDSLHRLETNGASASGVNYNQTAGINNSMSFGNTQDNSTSVSVSNASFDTDVIANENLLVDGALVVGNSQRFQRVLDSVTGEYVEVPVYLPSMVITGAQQSYNEVTGATEFTPGAILLNDISIESSEVHGKINGKNLSVELIDNPGSGYGGSLFGPVTIQGNGTTVTIEITDTPDNRATYVAGAYIYITGAEVYDTPRTVILSAVVVGAVIQITVATTQTAAVTTFGKTISIAPSYPYRQSRVITRGTFGEYALMDRDGFHLGTGFTDLTIEPTAFDATTHMNSAGLETDGGVIATQLDITGNSTFVGTSTFTGTTSVQTSSGNGVRMYASDTTAAIGGFRPYISGTGDATADFLWNNTTSAWNSDQSLSTNARTGVAATQAAGTHLHPDGYGLFSRSNATVCYIHRFGTTGTSTMVQFLYNGTNNGTINVASGGTPAFASGSDYRIKEDVQPVTDALERMKGIQAYTFRKIKEVDPEQNLQTGFIAHEVAAVHPEAVIGEKDAVDEDGNPEYQQVMDAKLTPLMAQAIKELIEKNEALEARIAALEAR